MARENFLKWIYQIFQAEKSRQTYLKFSNNEKIGKDSICAKNAKYAKMEFDKEPRGDGDAFASLARLAR